MIQIYFLSIFFNVLAGYTLVSEDDKNALEIRPGFSLKDETTRLILGILSMVTGVLKLLSSVDGDIPILGDLFPAAAGFAAGFILVYSYYRNRNTVDQEKENRETFVQILLKNKKIIGFIAIAAAALHFLFPRVLFL